jgi:outer membrane protein
MLRINRFWLAAVVGAALSCSVLPAQIKVAIVNTQKAILDTAEIQKAQAAMEAEFKPRQEKLQKLQKELQDIQDQLQKMQGKLAAEAERDLTLKGQRAQKDLTREQEDLQADVDNRRNDILARVGRQMQAVVQKLAEEKGFDVVLDAANTVYFKNALEITAEATAAYDKTYPAK